MQLYGPALTARRSPLVTGDWDFSDGGLVIPKAASAPDPSEAKVFHHTTDDLVYYYDDLRSRWLSFEHTEIMFNWTRTALGWGTQWVRMTDCATANTSAVWGYCAPRDGTVVSGHYGWRSGAPPFEDAGACVLTADGSGIGGLEVDENRVSTTLSGDFSQGDALGCFHYQGIEPGFFANWFLRWRTS